MKKITDETLTEYIFDLCSEDQKEIIHLKISKCSVTRARYEQIRRNFMQLNDVNDKRIEGFPIPLKLIIAASIFIGIFLIGFTEDHKPAIAPTLVKNDKNYINHASLFSLQNFAKMTPAKVEPSFQDVFSGSLKLSSPQHLGNVSTSNDLHAFANLRFSAFPTTINEKENFEIINLKGI